MLYTAKKDSKYLSVNLGQGIVIRDGRMAMQLLSNSLENLGQSLLKEGKITY
jgi:hypothetical protein